MHDFERLSLEPMKFKGKKKKKIIKATIQQLINGIRSAERFFGLHPSSTLCTGPWN